MPCHWAIISRMHPLPALSDPLLPSPRRGNSVTVLSTPDVRSRHRLGKNNPPVNASALGFRFGAEPQSERYWRHVSRKSAIPLNDR